VGLRRLFEVGIHGGLDVDEYSRGAQPGLPTTCGAFSVSSPGCPFSGSQQGAGVGLYLRGGLQFNDRWGAEVEGSFGTTAEFQGLFGPASSQTYVRGALTGEATFGDWFTLALGPVVSSAFQQTLVGVDLTHGVSNFATESATAVGGTLRTDFHLAPSRSPSGRSAFTLGLAVDLGETVAGDAFSSDGLAVGAYATAGWAWY